MKYRKSASEEYWREGSVTDKQKRRYAQLLIKIERVRIKNRYKMILTSYMSPHDMATIKDLLDKSYKRLNQAQRVLLTQVLMPE